MKVKQLIRLLQKQNPESPVIVDGYEGGYSDVTKIKKQGIKLNSNTELSYYGKHEAPSYDEKADIEAVLIPRN